jgi:uncharacterized protein (TIGR02271 family)
MMTEVSSTNTTVAGFFEKHKDAARAVTALHEAGFTRDQVGLARNGSKDNYNGSDAHEGAWEKVKNFFSGDEAEPYADERTRGDLATREITQTGGYDLGDGYDAGDLHGSFQKMEIPEEHSKYFTHRLENSGQGTVVTVRAGDRLTEAEDILEQNGADLGDESAKYDYAKNQKEPVAGQQQLQLLGEVLRVHKDRVNLGEVRLRKEVITETQTIEVPVTREELVLERVAVDGQTTASGQIGDNAEIRIPLSEERASLDKSTVVREQVSVGKRSIENVKNLTGDVQHEELVVEDETKSKKSF